MPSGTFGQMLTALISSIAATEKKKTSGVEDNLGELVGLSASSIRHYKGGNIPPNYQVVGVLAREAVVRDARSRNWTERFLRAADYPATEKLLGELFPHEPDKRRRSRPKNVLPTPLFSTFIPRTEAFNDVAEGLGMRQAAVFIVGFPGVGKTTLALEVATEALKAITTIPRFDAVVWVTDENRFGATTLNTVLNHIARDLDYPGLAQLEIDEKRDEIDSLLSEQRVLVIIDNFESITDKSLLKWLLRLPSPSKALVTTRVNEPGFERGGYIVKMEGMSKDEAFALIRKHSKQIKIETHIQDDELLESLIAVSAGNPKAITLALGCIRAGQQLDDIVVDLQNARGEVIDDLLPRSWELCKSDGQQLLYTMSLCPGTASIDLLTATTGQGRFTAEKNVAQLTLLSMLDEHKPPKGKSRYSLHPLVRVFAQARLDEEPELKATLLRKWVDWCIDLVSKVGFCFNDLGRLETLDLEQDMIYTVIQRTSSHGWDEDTIKLVDGIIYYYYVRGMWERKKTCRLLQIKAARQCDNKLKEVEALSFLITLLSRQNHLEEAQESVRRLLELDKEISISGDTFFHFKHALASYYMAQGDMTAALVSWQASFERVQEFTTVVAVDNRQWLALCFYRMDNLDRAHALFEEALREAEKIHFQRAIVFCATYLAAAKLKRGEIHGTAELLAHAYSEANRYHDRRRIADIKRIDAHRHKLQHDYKTAYQALTEAIELYDRLAMKTDVAGARSELFELEMLIER
jgi:tetratricopeptide (TPR) repeat protein